MDYFVLFDDSRNGKLVLSLSGRCGNIPELNNITSRIFLMPGGVFVILGYEELRNVNDFGINGLPDIPVGL